MMDMALEEIKSVFKSIILLSERLDINSKQMTTKKFNIGGVLFIITLCAIFFYSCDEEKIYPETRLFRPVLNQDLQAVGNTIVVNMGNLKKAVSYTVEVSRDTFKTIDYTIQSDTSQFVINDELLNGDPLFWATLYQLRAVAHAEDPQYDSKVSDLGNVKTQQFPTILNTPKSYDVIDVAARVSWLVAGAKVTGIKVFAGNDLKLTTPLLEFVVPDADQESGETFVVQGLDPATKYQVAIYSEDELRGWVDYQTLVQDIDPAASGVHDLTGATDPTAVATEVAAAADGDVILIARGSKFDMPTVALNKSITIRAAYGFQPKKAMLYNTNGNWNIAGGSTIDHIRFVDLELRGGNFSGTYVFNPATDNISVNEITFENCYINTMRGIMRIRNNNVVIENYNIINTVVDSIGSYGLLTTDTNVNGPPSTTAQVHNILFQNSTFNHLQFGLSTYNNMQSITIESYTFSNMVTTESGNYIFRFRGGAGNNDVINGISIKNSIFGPGWNISGTATNNIRGKDGLPNTTIEVINTYGTSDWAFIATYEITGLPSSTYLGTQTALWVDPAKSNFNFKDTGFAGKYNTGDPRWRIKL